MVYKHSLDKIDNFEESLWIVPFFETLY